VNFVVYADVQLHENSPGQSLRLPTQPQLTLAALGGVALISAS
jgi:hypothetical protein